MISRRRSAPSCEAISMERTTSANSTVTCLYSAGVGSATGAPQMSQNRAPGRGSPPHARQASCVVIRHPRGGRWCCNEDRSRSNYRALNDAGSVRRAKRPACRRTAWSVRDWSMGAAPLNTTCEIVGYCLKRQLKSLGTMLSRSTAESRLPSRRQDRSTSHTAIPPAHKRCDPRVVGCVGVEPENLAGDPAERVARIAVIPLGGKRHCAGHVAEDQDTGVVTDNRCE